jgi:hypothetical protein
LDFFDIVKYHYQRAHIIILDGDDLFFGDINTLTSNIDTTITDNGTFYKREIYTDISNAIPIGFAYPENKIPKNYINKEKVLAHVIPGVPETFVFTNETDYFIDYQISMFAYTWRKAGWDCLRHYEILCNNCIPLFLDIEYCPENTCTTIPKQLLIEYYKKSGIYDIFELNRPIEYSTSGSIIINRDLTLINKIDINDHFIALYYEYLEKIFNYSKDNLTTKKLAKQILKLI